MFALSHWKPRPAAFATIFGWTMLVGDVYSGNTKNPVATTFYSFLPAVFWIMEGLRKRDAQQTGELNAWLERLERASGHSNADGSPRTGGCSPDLFWVLTGSSGSSGAPKRSIESRTMPSPGPDGGQRGIFCI